MVKIAIEHFSTNGHFITGEAENLMFGNNSFDVVFSNSVLHWLNIEKDGSMEKALEEIFRVLAPGGIFAVSVAGHGTARKFQDAYHKVIMEVKEKSFFDSDMYVNDPISSLSLSEFVDSLEKTGFDIKKAHLDYEPVFYSSTEDYVNDVKAYGYGAYLGAIKESYRERIWKKLKDSFVEAVGGFDYLHDQYMIYAIARKPGRINAV